MSEPEKPAIYPQPSQLAAYAKAGWAFVKLHHFSETRILVDKAGKKKVMQLGKAPIGKSWQKGGVSLEEAVQHMNGGKNVGAPIPEGWAVLDVDPRNFPDGRKVLREFGEKTGFNLGDVPSVITGGGGRHFFLRLPAGYRGSVHHPDFPGIEFKQHGTQVVTAGSIHPETRRYYNWAPGQNTIAEAPECPESILALFRVQAPSGAKQGASGSWSSLTLDQIADGLKKLDPSNFRDQETWFGLMCSTHWLSGGEAIQEFIDWSTSDPSYTDHEEIITMRWDSLSRGAGSAELAAKGGQFFKALKAVGEDPLASKWQVQPEKDFNDYDEDEFETDAKNIGLKVQAQLDHTAKTHGGIIQNMNAEHFVLDHKGKTVVGRISEEEDDHGANITVYTFSDVTSFHNFYANQLVKGDGGEPEQISQWWFHHPQRLTYSKMEFRPDRSAGSYRDNNGKLILNQWNGWAIEPKPGDWSYFADLLENTICGGDKLKYEYLLNWFAASYQWLDGPVGAAVCINGLKGTGKTTIWEIFSKPFGSSHAMATSRMEELFGNFNGRMMGKAALLIEEALFAESKIADNNLKDWITGSKVPINEKFLPAYTQRNFLRIMIFTNSDHIIRATEDERRYFVTKALPNRKNDKVFWDALYQQMFEQEGCNAFFHDMMERDLTGWDAQGDIPWTKELIEQITMTRGAVVDWMMEKFETGEEAFSYTWYNRKREFVLPINEFWMDFAQWQNQRSKGRFDNPIRSQSGFSRELKRIFSRDEKHGYEDLALTTASVPDDKTMEIKSHEALISGKTYCVAKVYRFSSYHAFYHQFASKYGIEEMYYNPAMDGDDETDVGDFDFGTTTPATDEWDIL